MAEANGDNDRISRQHTAAQTPAVKGHIPEEKTGLPGWVVGLSLVVLSHLIWAWFNDAPLIWDMAYHEMKGWQFLQAWREASLWGNVSQLSPIYPPLFYLQEAVWIALVGESPFLGVLSNLGAILLLSWSTWRIALRWLGAGDAGAAGILVLLFPEIGWISREPLLDLWLAAWVALAAFCILKSEGFQRFGWTLAFGCAVAGGVLTKWTCPLYLFVPVAWTWWQGDRRLKALGNLAAAAALSVPLILPYYLPNLADFLARYPTTHQAGLIPWQPYPRHGEPGLNNFKGWIYYPRIMASYFLQLPLLLLGLAGWATGRKTASRLAARSPRLNVFLWVWLLGGLAALTFLSPKDPRFAVPLAPPLAILLVAAWRGRPRGTAAVLATAAIAFLLASFPTPPGKFKLALWEKQPDPDFQGLQQEWALLQTHYFDIVGPPRQEDWAYRPILAEIPDGSRVGFLPELPRFNAEGLQLEAVRKGRQIRVARLGAGPQWERYLERVDYLVVKTGPQGISFTTQYNPEVASKIEAGGWRRIGSWPLPDDSQALLWSRTRED